MSFSVSQRLLSAAVLKDCMDLLDILGLSISNRTMRDRPSSQEKDRLKMVKSDCQSISKEINKLCSEVQEGTLSFSPDTFEEKLKQIELAKKMLETIQHKKLCLQRLEQENYEINLEVENKVYMLKKLKVRRIHMEKQKNEEEREEEKLPLKDFEQKLLQNWPTARKIEPLEVLEEEKRFHDKTTEFLQNQHEKLEQELHMLKEKTQQIQQENQEKFNTLGCKKTLQTDRLMEMKRKFREMEQVVKEYREEQEILRQKEAEDRAAIKIQAWWRGCMFRLGLSAFSRERESKKSKKTKGKRKTKGK